MFFFNYVSSTRHPFCLLESNLLSTLASLFLHISLHYFGHLLILASMFFLLQSLRKYFFLMWPFPLLILPCPMHLRPFSSSKTCPSGTRLASRGSWHLVSSVISFNLSFSVKVAWLVGYWCLIVYQPLFVV